MSCLESKSCLCHFACLEEHPTPPALCPSESAEIGTCQVSEILAADQEPPSKAQVKTELRKLHNNLGHPTNRELIRVLKNAGGSEMALRLASDFMPSCVSPSDCWLQSSSRTRCEESSWLAADPSSDLFECDRLCIRFWCFVFMKSRLVTCWRISFKRDGNHGQVHRWKFSLILHEQIWPHPLWTHWSW